MASKILKCVVCNKFTLEKIHCEKETINPKPAKYSVDDKYQSYRLKYKKSHNL